jgi:hypothetical protein
MDYAREQVDEFVERFLDEVSAPISTDARYKIANNTQGMGGSCDLDLWEPYNADCDNIRVGIPGVPRGGILVYDDDIAEIELIEMEKNNMARSRVRERGDEYSGGQESEWSNRNNQRPWEDAMPGIYTMYNNPNNEIRDIKSENLYRRLGKENQGDIMVGGVPVGGVNVGGVNVGGVNVGGSVEGLQVRQQGVSGSYGSGLIGGKKELPQALKVWNAALQMWNEDKDKYCIPKKGTKAYDEVRAIADDMKKAVKKPAAKAKRAPAKKPAVKKPAARPGTKRKQAAPKPAAPKQAAPKQAAPKRAPAGRPGTKAKVKQPVAKQAAPKRAPAGRPGTKAKVKQPAAKKAAAKRAPAGRPGTKAKKAKPMEEIELELNERLKEFEKTQPTGRRGPINIASHRKPVAKKPAVKAKTQRQRERQRQRKTRTKQNVENPKEVTFNNQPEENLESMLVDLF